MASADIISLRAIQAVGITASALLSGTNIAYSFVSIPVIQLPDVGPVLATKQFRKLYDIGKDLALSATAAGALSNGYVLYRSLNSWPMASRAPTANLLVGAIVAQVSFVIYTVAFMGSRTNKRMFEFEAEAKAGGLKAKLDADKVNEELETWKFMNGIRALIPGAGALLGLLASWA